MTYCANRSLSNHSHMEQTYSNRTSFELSHVTVARDGYEEKADSSSDLCWHTLSSLHTSPLILTIYKQGHMTAQAQIRYMPEALSGCNEEDNCIPWRSTQGPIPNQAVPPSYAHYRNKKATAEGLYRCYFEVTDFFWGWRNTKQNRELALIKDSKESGLQQQKEDTKVSRWVS